MAERRMFAKTIVLSDAFLDMPMSARCLYFTLGMVADDDGFVNSPKSIMRQCGASNDDMNLLIAKKFILIFEDGVIVIKHWRILNYIQKDRYVPTKYEEHKKQLFLDENNSYSKKQGMYTNCIQTVYKMDTQDSIEIGKDNIISSSTIKSREYEIKEKESYLNNNRLFEIEKPVNNKGVLLKGGKYGSRTNDDNEPLSAETLKDDLETFCSRFGIMIDNYNYRISEMDFKSLTERFEESEWLKANVTSFKKICDIYPKIISGYYKDYNRKPKGSREFDILQRMLKEAEEEEREKQEKGESDNGPQESS